MALVTAAVAIAAPTASFTWSPPNPQPGETVNFTSTSQPSSNDFPITNYRWDLDGDGNYGEPGEPAGSTADTASRSFSSAGGYTIGLEVTDSDGQVDTETQTVNVQQPAGATSGAGTGPPSQTPLGESEPVLFKPPSVPGDSDGDALTDALEKTGDVDGDGTRDLPLGRMGARPNHKDLFVEVDWMAEHTIANSALDTVRNAFAQAPVSNPDGTTGINLHVDNGPDSTMSPGRTWGTRSRHDVGLPHAKPLGSYTSDGKHYDWSAFEELKNKYFDADRRKVFHYAIVGHNFGSKYDSHAGIARGIPASDFLVTLGEWCDVAEGCSGTTRQQATVFMHELGHNLNLHHGGYDDVNYKPNYLSIMNYLFSIDGLQTVSGKTVFDYSRFNAKAITLLNEYGVDERAGLFGAGSASSYKTARMCYGVTREVTFNAPVNWNCDGSINLYGVVAADVNYDGGLNSLRSFDDWANISFVGGTIGLAAALPRRTLNIEPTRKELLAPAAALIGDSRPPTVKVRLRRLHGRRRERRVQVIAKDNKGLEQLIVNVDGKPRTFRADGKREVVTLKLRRRKRKHVVKASALDEVGFAANSARRRVRVR